MKKGNSTIYLLMILLTFLIICLWYGIYDKYNNGTVNRPIDNTDNNSSSDIYQTIIYTWDAIYNKEDNTKQLSFVDNNGILTMVDKTDGTIIYYGSIIEDNLYMFEIDSLTYTIQNNDESITISSENESELNGTYIKVEEYNVNSLYNDTINNPSYLNNIWNGIYGNDNYTTKIYQLDKYKFIVTIYDANNIMMFRETLTIENSSLNYESDVDGVVKRMKISFSESNLVITSSSTNADDPNDLLGGNYIKSGSYTYDQIVADM